MLKQGNSNALTEQREDSLQQISIPGTETDTPWEEMHLSLSELYSGQPYQRPVKDPVVDRLVREWDPPPVDTAGGQLPGWPILLGGWSAPGLLYAQDERWG